MIDGVIFNCVINGSVQNGICLTDVFELTWLKENMLCHY